MKKIICLLLSVSLMLSLASCVKDVTEEENKDREISLKIETLAPVYSDELKESAAEALSDATEIIIYKKEKLKLSESEKQELKTYVKNSVLSVFSEIPIYENELRSLCDYAMYVAENYEQSSIVSVYTNLVSLLGNERNASLYYELIYVYLVHTRDDFKAKYEQTSYPWHLLESEKCDAMLKDLTSLLGKEKFSTAFDFSVMCIAFTSGMLLSENAESQAFKLSAGELNMLLHRHSMLLSEKNLSDEEWSAAFRIAEYTAQKKLKLADPVRNAVISALVDNSFFEAISVSTNDFIKLYESFSLHLSDEQCEMLIHGSNTEFVNALCEVLSSCRESLTDFLKALENGALPDSSIGFSELKAIGYGEEYGNFINEYTSISADEFVSLICDFADSDSDIYTALSRAVISYIYGISPCLAFLVSCELQGTEETKGA